MTSLWLQCIKMSWVYVKFSGNSLLKKKKKKHMLELQGVLVISFREACSVNLCLVCILYFAWHKVHLRIQFWLWDCCQLLPLCCVSTLPLHCASVARRNYLSHLNCAVMICRTLEANTDYLRRLYKIGFQFTKKQRTKQFLLLPTSCFFFFFRLNDQNWLTLDEALTITHDAAAL